MRTGRPVPALLVTDDEREILERWERRPNSAQALALRARSILACEIRMSNTEVAELFGVSNATVGKWRSRRRRKDVPRVRSRP
jgi:hypothetical protein